MKDPLVSSFLQERKDTWMVPMLARRQKHLISKIPGVRTMVTDRLLKQVSQSSHGMTRTSINQIIIFGMKAFLNSRCKDDSGNLQIVESIY
jgi:hypothetical protein